MGSASDRRHRGGALFSDSRSQCVLAWVQSALQPIRNSSNIVGTIDPESVEYRRYHRLKAVLTWVSSPISWNFLESGNAGKLVIQRTALKRASVHGCFSGRNSCDIYLWWILWISIYRLRRSWFVRGAFCLRRELPEPGARRAVDGAENEQNAIHIFGYFRANLWLFCRPARSTTATATPHRPSSPAMGKKEIGFFLPRKIQKEKNPRFLGT